MYPWVIIKNVVMCQSKQMSNAVKKEMIQNINVYSGKDAVHR